MGSLVLLSLLTLQLKPKFAYKHSTYSTELRLKRLMPLRISSSCMYLTAVLSHKAITSAKS